MSINFPFDTAEEFLEATKKVKKMEAPKSFVNVLDPAMPDLTPSSKAGIAAAIAGVAAFVKSDDVRIQIATIAASTVVVCALLIHDAIIRKARNERIGLENATHLSAAADMHVAEASDGE